MLIAETSSLRWQAAVQCFHEFYGAGAVHVLRAPARINILGEHVDYVSYLPTASLALGSREHAMWLLWRATEDRQVRGASTDERFAPFSFPVDEITADAAQHSWESYLFNRPLPAPHWSNYVRGAIAYARWQQGAQIKRGFSFLIDATIPPNSGASSSSALVVLSGAAIRLANQIEFQLAELARDSAQAEWFAGTRGGALDHMTICLAQAGSAVHIAHTEQRSEQVSLPDDELRWLTFFTHPADKGREVMLAYNERAAVARVLIPAVISGWDVNKPQYLAHWVDCREAWRAGAQRALDGLQALLNELPATLTLQEAAEFYPPARAECQRLFPMLAQEKSATPLKLRDRAQHHLGEIRRVAAAVELLRGATSNEAEIEVVRRAFGQLINESHASLRDLYEVSTPQVERLVAIVRADPQVYGARLMGGGFGGNVLVLTTAANVQRLVARVQEEFYRPQGRDGINEGAVMISTPGAGLTMQDWPGAAESSL